MNINDLDIKILLLTKELFFLKLNKTKQNHLFKKIKKQIAQLKFYKNYLLKKNYETK